MITSVQAQPLGITQRVPLIGQQQQQPTQEQIAKMRAAQVMQAVHDMASAMYVQLATPHIAGRNWEIGEGVDVVHLRQLSSVCMTAAKAFFDGIGVLEQGD